MSKLNCPGPFIRRIKKPPAIAIFFKKEVIWTWSEKFEWKITAVAIQKRKRTKAEILVLYPTIINRGKIIDIGTHNELLKNSAIYKNLYSKQLSA